MDINVDISGFLEIHVWICYGVLDQGIFLNFSLTAISTFLNGIGKCNTYVFGKSIFWMEKIEFNYLPEFLGDNLIGFPSSLRHVTCGVGRPTAEHRSVTSFPSSTSTSLLVLLSSMSGGSGNKKKTYLIRISTKLMGVHEMALESDRISASSKDF